MEYIDLIQDFKENPRDIPTAPKSRVPKWFHVFVRNNTLYVESANHHVDDTCDIQGIRILNPNEHESIFSLYQKRNTTSISAEAQQLTHNSSYWFGIFENYLQNHGK